MSARPHSFSARVIVYADGIGRLTARCASEPDPGRGFAPLFRFKIPRRMGGAYAPDARRFVQGAYDAALRVWPL